MNEGVTLSTEEALGFVKYMTPESQAKWLADKNVPWHAWPEGAQDAAVWMKLPVAKCEFCDRELWNYHAPFEARDPYGGDRVLLCSPVCMLDYGLYFITLNLDSTIGSPDESEILANDRPL